MRCRMCDKMSSLDLGLHVRTHARSHSVSFLRACSDLLLTGSFVCWVEGKRDRLPGRVLLGRGRNDSGWDTETGQSVTMSPNSVWLWKPLGDDYSILMERRVRGVVLSESRVRPSSVTRWGSHRVSGA
jgi:hypothetical protein